jgi:hypothetical protein
MFDFEHQENLIKQLLSRLDELFTHMQTPGMFMSEDEVDSGFRIVSKKAYIACCAYIEAKGLHSYLQDFKLDIQPAINDDKQLFQGTEYNEALGQSFSVIVDRFYAYLSVFFAFGDISFVHKRPGLKYLEYILHNTSTILNKMSVNPDSETKIYNAVKFVCEVTFPDHESTTDSFIKKAKCYRPDILIPSLNCAVEYKYAADERGLANTIDQILVDTKGYESHSVYKLFYAVFYVPAGVLSNQRFNEIWDEKSFPKNWKGILVTGR